MPQSVFVSDLTPEIVDILATGYSNATTPLSLIITDYQDVDGKANNETAWGCCAVCIPFAVYCLALTWYVCCGRKGNYLI